MKFLKLAVVVLVLLVNFAIVRPAWADVNLTKTPAYAELTDNLNRLLKTATDPNQTDYTEAELQQQIGQLQLQKYILETSEDWAQCRNQTGQTIAVYANKPKKATADQPNTLFYLGVSEETDDDWNCNGFYLPAGTNVAGVNSIAPQELGEAIALKVLDGAQIVATTNPDTGAVEFNLPPAKVFKAGDVSWDIPSLTQADIAAQTPNAPVD
ncbi:hypothetical protein H6F67_24185 [Microcoleus sp. FACHB-1515]|uniref:hypothetical protein n=1 Tax=Cyanophyceae TaxID=3028117 RepID=UPI001686862E|nr:hypothetical protein [Microcoleus sp. FACHB-1515]MBD2092952.1 hypothetical protein [Microcoleus sp. FACHB-1515]